MFAKQEITPEVRRRVISWIVRAAFGLVLYGLIILLPAGRWDWVWGWVMLGILAAVIAAHPLILVPINPELLAEREKGFLDKGVKTWDKWINFLTGGLMAFLWVVAGLDTRFGWTTPMPRAYHLGGLLLTILGYALFMWSMASNAFFAEGVRIQTERGHTVATSGPYRFVRHPGYVGTFVAHLGSPFLLGSLWALIPAGLLVGLLITRTYLEDKTLMAELPGYQAYAQHTTARLLPGVW